MYVKYSDILVYLRPYYYDTNDIAFNIVKIVITEIYF